MYVSQVKISFPKLEKVLNLPKSAKIVAASEEGPQVLLRIVSENQIDQGEYKLPDDLSRVGDLYRTKSSRGFSDPTPMRDSTQ